MPFPIQHHGTLNITNKPLIHHAVSNPASRHSKHYIDQQLAYHLASEHRTDESIVLRLPSASAPLAVIACTSRAVFCAVLVRACFDAIRIPQIPRNSVLTPSLRNLDIAKALRIFAAR